MLQITSSRPDVAVSQEESSPFPRLARQPSAEGGEDVNHAFCGGVGRASSSNLVTNKKQYAVLASSTGSYTKNK